MLFETERANIIYSLNRLHFSLYKYKWNWIIYNNKMAKTNLHVIMLEFIGIYLFFFADEDCSQRSHYVICELVQLAFSMLCISFDKLLGFKYKRNSSKAFVVNILPVLGYLLNRVVKTFCWNVNDTIKLTATISYTVSNVAVGDIVKRKQNPA